MIAALHLGAGARTHARPRPLLHFHWINFVIDQFTTRSDLDFINNSPSVSLNPIIFGKCLPSFDFHVESPHGRPAAIFYAPIHWKLKSTAELIADYYPKIRGFIFPQIISWVSSKYLPAERFINSTGCRNGCRNRCRNRCWNCPDSLHFSKPLLARFGRIHRYEFLSFSYYFFFFTRGISSPFSMSALLIWFDVWLPDDWLNHFPDYFFFVVFCFVCCCWRIIQLFSSDSSSEIYRLISLSIFFLAVCVCVCFVVGEGGRGGDLDLLICC